MAVAVLTRVAGQDAAPSKARAGPRLNVKRVALNAAHANWLANRQPLVPQPRHVVRLSPVVQHKGAEQRMVAGLPSLLVARLRAAALLPAAADCRNAVVAARAATMGSL